MAIKPYEAGSRAGGGLSGMLILKSSSKLKLWRASYGKGTTLVRPWGDTYTDDAGGVHMTPYRDNDGHFGTSFFIQDAVCEGWGKDSRLTFMTRVEDENNWPAGSPADIFYNEISGHPDFKWLTERPSAKDFAPLSRPTVNGFLKGLLLECGGNDYKGSPVWGCILRLSKSAKEAFEQLLDTENPNPEPNEDPDDPNGWYKKFIVGDPIGFDQGKIFEFDKASKFTATSVNAGEINLDARGGDGSKPAGGGDAIEKYACRMWPSRPALPIPAERTHNCNEGFAEAIQYLTGEEQISQVIIPGFGRSCKDAVTYVFGGKDILPATFEFGRTTHDMGGGAKPDTTPPADQAATTGQSGTVQQPVTAPAQAAPAQEVPQVSINLDGPDNPAPEGGEAPPFTPDPTVPVTVADAVTTAPAGQPAAAPASDTANALRSRLDAAKQPK